MGKWSSPPVQAWFGSAEGVEQRPYDCATSCTVRKSGYLPTRLFRPSWNSGRETKSIAVLLHVVAMQDGSCECGLASGKMRPLTCRQASDWSTPGAMATGWLGA